MSEQVGSKFVELLTVIKFSGQLVGKCLISNEFAVLTGLNRQVIIVPGLILPPENPCPLRLHQHFMLSEGIRSMPGPFADPAEFLTHSGLCLSPFAGI
ncbi:hypothetical protein D3C75_592390 [compost metagenome]